MLNLDSVTLCAIDCAHPLLALRALDISMAQCRFGDALFLSDTADRYQLRGCRMEAIAPIASRESYSRFVLKELGRHIRTDHVLLIQWDGYVIDPGAWRAEFLEYDYIGAPWPWYQDDHRVGNGGFSLRSRRLAEALLDDAIVDLDPEDEAIGRRYRTLLESKHGIRFAPLELAETFSFETKFPKNRPFGFHGLFNMWMFLPEQELVEFISLLTPSAIAGTQFLSLGKCYLDAGRQNEAVIVLRRRLEVSPNDAEARRLLASLAPPKAVSAASADAAPRRNDPCPCGSGKRYKQCCGSVAGEPPPATPAPRSDDPAALLHGAMAHHQAGRLEAAETLYRRVIELDARNAIALQYLGVLAMQRSDLSAAEKMIREALTLRSDVPDFFSNLGLVLRLQERHAEASEAYRRALALDPNHMASHNNLGLALLATGDPEEAARHFRRALELEPRFAQAHANLGTALKDCGRESEAEAAYRAALALNPNDPDVHLNLGHLLSARGKFEEAEAAYRRAIALRPDHAGTQYHLGRLLKEHLEKFDAAEQALRRALALSPGDADIQYHLGDLLHLRPGRLVEAESCFRQALSIQPDMAGAWNDLGIVLTKQQRFSEAEASFRRALEIRPESWAYLTSLGKLLAELQRFAEAEQVYRTAHRIAPEIPDVRWNLACLLLYQGRFEEGWPLYEARLDPAMQHHTAMPSELPFPRWQGESLAGRSLMVLPEQGFGDYLQFVRYAPILKQRGARRITLYCRAPLLRLLETADGVDEVIDVALPPRLDGYDFWTPLLSVPGRVGTRLETIPADGPYLRARPESVAFWRSRLPQGGLKVGLVWKGNTAHSNDANRSLRLETLAPLWSAAGIRFVSLQKGDGGAEAVAAPAGQTLIHLGSDIGDFADSAAIVSQLDLVICVDTAIAHLAGALGTPCWVMLPRVGTDWRWMDGRTDSPWYPGTMRLFRQARPGEWDPVVAQIASALRDFAAASR